MKYDPMPGKAEARFESAPWHGLGLGPNICSQSTPVVAAARHVRTNGLHTAIRDSTGVSLLGSSRHSRELAPGAALAGRTADLS